MRIRWISLALIALVFGAVGGVILAPQPANAVNRDMVELQNNVSQLMQGQQDLRSTVDANNATIKTLIQQSIDTVNKMGDQMGALQKSFQDGQANTGSRIDSMAQQTQGISDNLQDVQARVGKLSQQLSDMQNLLQSIDAKVSGSVQPAPGSDQPGSAPPPQGAPPNGQGSSYPQPPAQSNGSSPTTYNAPNGASNSYGNPYGSQPAYSTQSANPPAAMTPASMAPISADTLYQNALRDYTTGNYDLSHQEFSDYISHFPSSDLASNSQFYLGQISYAQHDYRNAIKAYDMVLSKYPQSIKLASALLKKAEAEEQLKERTSAIRDLREVAHRFPGSDESRRARGMLQSMGVSVTAPR